MGRSGYSEWDDCDPESQWAMIRQAGAREAALRSKRGQAFLRRLAAALDAMPVKSLVAIPSSEDGHMDKSGPEWKWVPPPGADRLGLPSGEVCVLGSLALAEGKNPAEIDATDYDGLAKMFDVAPTVVRDLEWENDSEYGARGDPNGGEKRWTYLRKWVTRNLAITTPGGDGGAGKEV